MNEWVNQCNNTLAPVPKFHGEEIAADAAHFGDRVGRRVKQWGWERSTKPKKNYTSIRFCILIPSPPKKSPDKKSEHKMSKHNSTKNIRTFENLGECKGGAGWELGAHNILYIITYIIYEGRTKEPHPESEQKIWLWWWSTPSTPTAILFIGTLKNCHRHIQPSVLFFLESFAFYSTRKRLGFEKSAW